MKVMLVCSGEYDGEHFQGASWVKALLDRFHGNNAFQVMVCYCSNRIYSKHVTTDNISYFGVLNRKGIYTFDKCSSQEFASIINAFAPDVIHVCGTEYPYALEVADAAKENQLLDRVLIVVQGLCSQIAKHYMDCIPFSVRYGFTLRDVLKLDNVYLQKEKMAKRGKNEVQVLTLVPNVSGRTEWDKASTYHINPSRNYYKCNEFLRDVFYNNQWNYNKCEKHSVFVTQSYYTIKGLGILLEAASLLIDEYPDLKIYTVNERLKQNSKIHLDKFSKYLHQKAYRLGLSESIEFLGFLSAEEMCEMYLKCNVFVSPSMIENSSNSIGEAMLLGCPIVSSHVGGATEFIVHNENGFLYQQNAAYMLAHYIRMIFEDAELRDNISQNARITGKKIFDRNVNFNRLIEIYNDIIQNTAKVEK